MIHSIDVHELAKCLKQADDLCLIDVRTLAELDLAALKYDLHIPLGEEAQHIDALPEDKPLFLYCHHGRRSFMAGMRLVELGIDPDRIYNVEGGIDAWSLLVDASVPRYSK